MEKGVIQSPQEISWNRKKHLMARAEFYDEAVMQAKLSFKGSAVVSYLCRECKKVIIDYEVGHDLNEIKKEPFWKKFI